MNRINRAELAAVSRRNCKRGPFPSPSSSAFFCPRRLLLLLTIVVMMGAPPWVKSLPVAEYNEAIALSALMYSSMAYAPPEMVASGLFYNESCNVDSLVILKVFKSPVTEAFALLAMDKAQHTVIAAFKGSNETQDFVTDLSSYKYYRDACLVQGVSLGNTHHGFCKYYNSLVDMGLTDAIYATAKDNPDFTVLLSGHSLGGAAAALCALDLYQRFSIQALLYTFGEPRVGDVSFSVPLEKAALGAFRVVHAADWIPHMPPCCAHLHLGACSNDTACPYHHVHEIWYDNDMGPQDPHITCQSPEDTACEHTVSMSIDDHLHYFRLHVGLWCGYPCPDCF